MSDSELNVSQSSSSSGKEDKQFEDDKEQQSQQDKKETENEDPSEEKEVQRKSSLTNNKLESQHSVQQQILVNKTKVVLKSNLGNIDVKLFVGQIPKHMTEEQISAKFSQFGEILESQILRDTVTKAHKGCAFVKFASLTKADEAIKEMNSKVILEGGNKHIQLRYADGETERLGIANVENIKLFVGSIPPNATDENLKDLFQQYGELEELHLMTDDNGNSKCCAFVKYLFMESALLAIRALNAQAYLLESQKPLEVRFADKKSKTPTQQGGGIGGMNKMGISTQQIGGYQQSAFKQVPPQPLPVQTDPNTWYEYTHEGRQCYYNLFVQQPTYERPPPGSTIQPWAVYQQQLMMQQQQQLQYQNYYQQPQMMQQQYQQQPFMTGQGQYGQMNKSVSQQYPAQQSINPQQGQFGQAAQKYPVPGYAINDLSGKEEMKRQGPPGANIFIFHLPNDWRESDLANAFNQFGEILSARIMTQKNEYGQTVSKGYGFISFSNAESAQRAVQQMNGFQASDKRRLKVQIKQGETITGQGQQGKQPVTQQDATQYQHFS